MNRDEVESHALFQKKADRLLATQTLQAVVRTICTIHQLDRDRHPLYTFEECQKALLKRTRDKIRVWTRQNAIERAAKPLVGFRLYKLPNVLKKV